MRQLRTDARQQRQPGAVQVMRQAVVDHCQHAGVAQQHLVHAARRRVAVIGRQYIGIEQRAQARQRGGEILDQAQRLGVNLQRLGLALARGVAQLKARLGQQCGQRRVQGVAHIEVFALFAQVHRAQAHGEQRATQLLENLAHRLARGQLAPALLATASAIAAAPLVTG